MTLEYEEFERMLDSHRAAEEAAAAAEVVARLRRRGVTVVGGDRPEDLVNLLTAVERFEAAVEAHGGDLMVDDLKSVEPDDQHFVLPPRPPGEGVAAYVGRIYEATAGLRRHPSHPD